MAKICAGFLNKPERLLHGVPIASDPENSDAWYKTTETAYEDKFAKLDLDLAAATLEAAHRVIDAMFVDKNPTGFGGYELHLYMIPIVWKFYSEGAFMDIHSAEIDGPLEELEHPRHGEARSL